MDLKFIEAQAAHLINVFLSWKIQIPATHLFFHLCMQHVSGTSSVLSTVLDANALLFSLDSS